jgi:hypothetical protein
LPGLWSGPTRAAVTESVPVLELTAALRARHILLQNAGATNRIVLRNLICCHRWNVTAALTVAASPFSHDPYWSQDA